MRLEKKSFLFLEKAPKDKDNLFSLRKNRQKRTLIHFLGENSRLFFPAKKVAKIRRFTGLSTSYYLNGPRQKYTV